MSPNTQTEDLTKRLNDLERQMQLLKKSFGQNQVTNHHDLLGSGQTAHADLDFHVENRDNRRKHLSATEYTDLTDGGATTLHTHDGLADGWMALPACTYASADDPTYTFTIASDYTGILSTGMRFWCTQSTGGTKYGMISKTPTFGSGVTTVTLYMGTDYDLNNEAITSPQFSFAKMPYGFPMDETKWSALLTDANNNTVNCNAGAWTVSTLGLTVPIGPWELSYKCMFYLGVLATIGLITLSDTDNTESDPDFTAAETTYTTTGIATPATTAFVSKPITLTTKKTYKINAKDGSGGTGGMSLYGNYARIFIRAKSTLL